MDSLLKFVGQKPEKMKLHIQKTIDAIINNYAKDITESNKLI